MELFKMNGVLIILCVIIFLLFSVVWQVVDWWRKVKHPQKPPIKWNVFKIFLGSPSGLDTERKVFCKEVDFFNRIDAHPRNIHFEVVKWEDIPPSYGQPQKIINSHLLQCHCYILILWERWGAPPGGNKYESGCEEEFYLAEKCLKASNMRDIAVYFKKVDEDKKNSPDEQLRKVLAFREKVIGEHTLLFKDFSRMDEFKKMVTSYLADWVLEITGYKPKEGVQSVLDYEKLN
jgi:hypothetical protein